MSSVTLPRFACIWPQRPPANRSFPVCPSDRKRWVLAQEPPGPVAVPLSNYRHIMTLMIHPAADMDKWQNDLILLTSSPQYWRHRINPLFPSLKRPIMWFIFETEVQWRASCDRHEITCLVGNTELLLKVLECCDSYPNDDIDGNIH